MSIWEPEKLIIFLAFVFPGFISLKMYGLLIATKSRDYSKSIVESVCFSVLNFALFAWILIPISDGSLSTENHPFLFYFSIVLVFVIGPAIWPVILLKVMKHGFVSKYILRPYKEPWDYVFERRESMWVVVSLTDGSFIGGKYGTKSYASAHPEERQIYLEELWDIDITTKAFKGKIPRTKGAVFPSSTIKYLEFFG